MRLILVRHGQTEWNREYRVQGQADPPLNETGKAQAEAIARALSYEPIRAIYSSPLSRAMETAKTINRFHTVEIIPHEGLKELNVGEVDGLYFPDMPVRYPDFFARWKADAAAVRWPGGETLPELQDRVWRATTQIITPQTEGAAVITSHLFALVSLLCKVLGLNLSDFRRLNLSVGSISEVEITEKGYRLVRFNETCHLGSNF